MNIEHYISQLLYRHQCVIMPGFGAFLTERLIFCAYPVAFTCNNVVRHKMIASFITLINFNDMQGSLHLNNM